MAKAKSDHQKELEALKDSLNREFGEGVVKFANDPSLQIVKISSGSLTLDRVLGGGFPLGRSVLLWGDFATAKCVALDSYVIDSELGLVTMGELTQGIELQPDEWVTHERKIVSANGMKKTSCLYRGGVKPTIRVVTKTGLELEGSLNHPILVMGEDGNFHFVALRDLKIGDKPAIRRGMLQFANKTEITCDLGFNVYAEEVHQNKKFKYHTAKHIKFPKKVTKELARFLGYMIAEGDIQRKQLAFTQKDEATLNDFVAVADSLFGEGIAVKVLSQGRIGYVRICSAHLVWCLEQLGVKGKSRDKYIPDLIIMAPKEIQAEFLRAYMDMEISARNMRIVSASSKMIQQIQLMLLNFGVVSKVKHVSTCATNGSQIMRDYWMLSIRGDDLEIFEREIGLLTPRKVKVLSDKLVQKKEGTGRQRMVTTGRVPYQFERIARLRNDVRRRMGTYKSGKGAFGKDGLWSLLEKVDPLLTHRKYSSHRTSDAIPYDDMRSYVDALKPVASDLDDFLYLEDLIKLHYYYDEVIEIRAGMAEVWDFEVPDIHTFWSNGFVCHNTLTALKTIACAQKAGMTCGLIEPEKSLDVEWATRLGVNCDELIINRPAYGEKAMDVIYQMLKSKLFGVIVIDSIAALLPKAEMEKLAEQASVAELARIMSKALRKLTAANENTLLIFINQVREKVGIMFGSPKTQPGGRAMDFFSSQKIQFSVADKIKEKRIDFDPVKMKNVERLMVVGNYIQAVVEKDKTQALMRKAMFAFNYDLGDIDRTEEVLSLAMSDHLILKTGNSFVLDGEKFVGRKRIKNHLDMNPEVKEDLISKIEARTKLIGEEVPDVASIVDEEEEIEDKEEK